MSDPSRADALLEALLARFDRPAGGEYQVGQPAPPANDGTTGSIHHWDWIGRLRNALRRGGYGDIRVDQQQVAVRNGRLVVVGNNRPDIQATRGRRRFNIEVDTNPDDSRHHQRVITAHDPHTRGLFLVIDPRTGRLVQRRHYDPATGRTTVVRWPSRTGPGAARRVRRG
jgi:hypothetical protein